MYESGIPVAAPSANMSGKISPTAAEDVLKELDGKINYILDGGKCNVGIESTVIGFTNKQPEILRHGFVTQEEIEKIIGKVVSEKTKKIVSPGQLESHYAPATPLHMTDDFEDAKSIKNKRIGVFDLSKYKDLREAAVNLFSDLRKLDEAGYDCIVWKKVNEKGLGAAINDRLSRASINFKL